MSNMQAVQRIYEAFGRGDINTILEHLAVDVLWEYEKTESDVPWLAPRRGRGEVPGFFHALGGVAFQKFQPKTFLENGNIVVVLLDLAFTVKATGKSVVEEDEIHIWHFDDNGQVSKFCHKADTRQHWMALQSS